MIESPPRALRADALRNHHRIVAAARDAIEESGPAAQLDDIARRAGVAMATIYRRFAGRDDLVCAVFAQFFAAEVEPIVATATADHDAWHGLVQALEDTVATLVADFKCEQDLGPAQIIAQSTWEKSVRSAAGVLPASRP